MRSAGLFLFLLLAVISCDTYEENRFEDWDTDNDGNITRDEFRTSFTQLEYFKSWDTKKDGVMDTDEWGLGLKRVGYDPSEPIYGFFNEWDDNADRVLSEEEFREEFFEVWDKNDDGMISKEEYQMRYTYVD